MDIKEGLLLWFINLLIKVFDKKSASLLGKSVSGSGVNIPLEFNEQLAEELHKAIIRNFKKRTVYSRSKDYIWVLI